MNKNKRLNALISMIFITSMSLSTISLVSNTRSNNSFSANITNHKSNVSTNSIANLNQKFLKKQFQSSSETPLPLPEITSKYPSQVSDLELKNYVSFMKYEILKNEGVSPTNDATVEKVDIIAINDSTAMITFTIDYKFIKPVTPQTETLIKTTSKTLKLQKTNTELSASVVDRLFNKTTGIYRNRNQAVLKPLATPPDVSTPTQPPIVPVPPTMPDKNQSWNGNNLTITANLLAGYTKISDQAFSTNTDIKSSLQKIILPDSLISIEGSNVFKDTKLTELTITPNVSTISNTALCGMTNLTKVTFSDGFNATLSGSPNTDIFFKDTTKLQEVVFPVSMSSNISHLFDSTHSALNKITASYDSYYSDKHNWGQTNSNIEYTWLGSEKTEINPSITSTGYAIQNDDIKKLDIAQLTDQQIIDIILKENLIKGFPKYYHSIIKTNNYSPVNWVSNIDKYHGSLTLNVSLDEGFVEHSTSKQFVLKKQQISIGEIKLTGFNAKYDPTEIRESATTDITDVQEAEKYYLVLKADDTAIDEKLKEYIWINYIKPTDDKNPIKLSKEMITKIEVSAFDNQAGSLTITGITLSKSYTQTALIENKKFNVNIVIKGFKTISSATVITNSISIKNIAEIANIKINKITTENLNSAVIQAVQNPFNKNKLTTSDFSINETTIIKNFIGGIITLDYTIKPNKIVINDNNKLITNPSSLTYSLTINDFDPFYNQTTIKSPTTTVFETDQIPEYYNHSLNQSSNKIDPDFRLFIWTNAFITPTGEGYQLLNEESISKINICEYDNKAGTLIVESIELSKWYDADGFKDSTIENSSITPKTFQWKHTLSGFKKVQEESKLPPTTETFDVSDYLTQTHVNLEDLKTNDYKDIVIHSVKNTYRPLQYPDITINLDFNKPSLFSWDNASVPKKTFEYTINPGLVYTGADFSLNKDPITNTMTIKGRQFDTNDPLLTNIRELIPTISITIIVGLILVVILSLIITFAKRWW